MNFDKLNSTELYQLCIGAGLKVEPAADRELMVRMLEGLEEKEYQNPVDRYRLGLIGFATEYWDKIQTQIMCPMRSLPTNPKPCFGCLDTKAVSCVVNNRENERHINRHMPKKEEQK